GIVRNAGGSDRDAAIVARDILLCLQAGGAKRCGSDDRPNHSCPEPALSTASHAIPSPLWRRECHRAGRMETSDCADERDGPASDHPDARELQRLRRGTNPAMLAPEDLG